MECTSETRFDIYQMTNRTHLTIIDHTQRKVYNWIIIP